MNAEILHLCPRCRRAGGQAYRAVPDDEVTVRVLLRCDGCHHRWSVLVPQESLSPEAEARINRQSTWPTTS
jgi:hypothetical protein